MPAWELIESLGLALGLGLLVGLQRERTAPSVAGIRTFALITLAGALSALLSHTIGPWIVGAGLLAVVATTVVGNVVSRPASAHVGITTEVAIIVMFAVGALCMLGPREVAVVVSGAVYLLLQVKAPLQRFVESLGKSDLRAIGQLVLVSLVILPILPDRTFGPYEVLNPRQIWWMVMLVMALSLAAYVAYKIVGDRLGVLLSGALGGLISSTATTVTQARLSRDSREPSAACAVVMVASTVLYARILVLIALTGPGFLRAAAAPIGLLGVVAALLSLRAWLRVRRDGKEAPEPKNPAQLGSALAFGAMFAIVLFAVAAARAELGDTGLYITAALGGLTDLDAITLSTTKLVSAGTLEASAGWRAIVVATIANTAMKLAIVAAIARGPLTRQLAPLYGVIVAASIIALVFG